MSAVTAVEVRDLHDLDDFEVAGDLIRRVWGTTPERSPLNVQQLPAMVHAGCQVSAAYDGGRMVGATMAFIGLEDGRPILHSHVTGVEPDRQGAGIGMVLKRHQRDWCLARGIDVVTWTFDPIAAPNVRFNLVHLGAHGAEYLRNFYGVMGDELNGEDETDRLVARWELNGPSADRALSGAARRPSAADLQAKGGVATVRRTPTGPDAVSTDAPLRLVAIPSDVVALRRAGAEEVPAWRSAVRHALEAAFAAGHVVVTLTTDDHLVTVPADERGAW